jgi:hypothetical protein
MLSLSLQQGKEISAFFFVSCDVSISFVGQLCNLAQSALSGGE